MSVDNFFSLVGFAFMFLSNLVAFSVLISRLGARLNFCESEIKSLKVRDDVQADELKHFTRLRVKLNCL